MIVELIGGLCNRLRCLVSLISSAEFEKIKLIWEPNRLCCNSHFNDLFDNNIEFISSHQVSPHLNMEMKTKNREFVEYNSQDYIKSWVELYFGDVYWLSYYDRLQLLHKSALSLVPNKTIRKLIHECYDRMDKNTYGIHIRRGMGINYNSESSLVSPTELFIEKMEEIVLENNNANFFIASDAQYETDNLKYIFGDRIIAIDHVRRFPLDSGYTFKGMERSVADLYLLSKTQKIFGGSGSSYSEFAGLLGLIEVEKLIDENRLEYFRKINEGKYNPTW